MLSRETGNQEDVMVQKQDELTAEVQDDSIAGEKQLSRSLTRMEKTKPRRSRSRRRRRTKRSWRWRTSTLASSLSSSLSL